MGIEIYSYELKLEAVKYFLEKGHSHKEAAEHFGVTLYPVEKWVNLYKCHGEKGLESRNHWNRAQTFTGEFKTDLLCPVKPVIINVAALPMLIPSKSHPCTSSTRSCPAQAAVPGKTHPAPVYLRCVRYPPTRSRQAEVQLQPRIK